MDIKLYPRALKNRMVFPLFTFSFQAIGKTVPTEIKITERNSEIVGRKLKITGRNLKIVGRNSEITGRKLKIVGRNSEIIGRKFQNPRTKISRSAPGNSRNNKIIITFIKQKFPVCRPGTSVTGSGAALKVLNLFQWRRSHRAFQQR